jgi:cold shock CspA family protein
VPKQDAARAWAAFETWRRDGGGANQTPTGDTEVGTVKFYDPARGIGFLGTPVGDVFLGRAECERAGIDPWPDDEVEFERGSAERGKPAALNPRIAKRALQEVGRVHHVKDGYGYIAPEAGGRSVYFSAKVNDWGAMVGDRVEFLRGMDARTTAARMRKA